MLGVSYNREGALLLYCGEQYVEPLDSILPGAIVDVCGIGGVILASLELKPSTNEPKHCLILSLKPAQGSELNTCKRAIRLYSTTEVMVGTVGKIVATCISIHELAS